MTPAERLTELLVAESADQPLDFLPFWGHKPSRDGSIGPGCLSQWWPCPFTVDGLRYPTAEHWMMAEKARCFDDADGLAAVMAAPSPGAAKALGRAVRGFDALRWREVRYDAVLTGNLAKFGQHPDLADFLRRTGRRVLVEASPTDQDWGIGLAADDERITRPSQWRGQNLLGFVLMDVRERL